MTTEYDQRDKRREYIASSLRRADLATKPTEQFAHWLEDAEKSGAIDATAMVLATTGLDGVPAARTVLLKHFDEQGFCWYTDYGSDKGQELANTPQACLLFYWRDLSRQIIIKGTVAKLDAESSDRYFLNRPEGSRLSAASSCQSSIVAGREDLQNAVEQLKQKYPSGDIPRPENWGGYCLTPTSFEFWQGREDRLHDRFKYSPKKSSKWDVDRLSP